MMAIKEVNEAYETGKIHERKRILEILKSADMGIFISEENFIHYEFCEWLDTLISTKDKEQKDGE